LENKQLEANSSRFILSHKNAVSLRNTIQRKGKQRSTDLKTWFHCQHQDFFICAKAKTDIRYAGLDMQMREAKQKKKNTVVCQSKLNTITKQSDTVA